MSFRLCVRIFFVLSLLFLYRSFSRTYILKTTLGEHGGKRAQHLEEDDGEKSEHSSDMRAIVKLMMEENQKAEARRVEEAKALEAIRLAEVKAEAERAEVKRLAEVDRAAADKLAEEERAEARRIAAEERAEARRRAEVIAAEDRAEARRLAEVAAAEERAEAKRERKLAAELKAEAKRVAEAKAAEELERVREETAQLASEKLMEQQEAMGAREYEQQVALIKMQAEIGEKAASAHREEQTVSRKRDRAVASIPNYRENDDI